MYKNGVASGGPWWNLSLQQYQPLWVSPESAKIADETMMQIVPYAQATYPNWGDVKAQVQRLEALQSYDDDAYQGGSCLKLNNVDGFNPDFIRIFVCDFDLSLPVVIRYAYKLAPDNLISPISSSSSSDPIDQSFGMVLKLRCPLDASKNGVKVFLSSEGRVDIDTPNNKSDGDISAEPVVDRAVNSWIFKAFRVKSKNCGYQIGEIAASLGSNSSVLLGFFAVEFGRA
ncbi:unnamed protein product [Notodromas monacha]|nr:unnamed protein product [Notodromas monacha]CAG0923628.1 unnamed protein product [Notodromas monacha]